MSFIIKVMSDADFRNNLDIFKKGSKTYFNSSRFFPKDVLRDVSCLYAFVRTVDDYVDNLPADSDSFFAFYEEYEAGVRGKTVSNPVIAGFLELSDRRNFDPAWADAFLFSMELDLKKREHHTLNETLQYIYGSAEVIGLFMCRILGLPDEAQHYAAMQGRAMQYINFIRDIEEDNSLGRRYLPLFESGLKDLRKPTVEASAGVFAELHRRHVALYKAWQKEADAGYGYIPVRYRIPVRTAADLYLWTASVIEKNPMIVYKKKVKPSVLRIFFIWFKNWLKRGMP